MNVRSHSVIASIAWCGLWLAAGPALARQQAPSTPVSPRRAEAVSAPAPLTTPQEITVQDTPVGPMLSDGKGYTLYVTDRDKEAGQSSCYGACAEQWVPLRAQGDAKPFGEWTVIARTDGQSQWAYKGRPLYRYRWEAKPRWAEAQNEYWRYASLKQWPPLGGGRFRGFSAAAVNVKLELPPSPGGITGQVTARGNVLADFKGMTLYARSGSGPCTGACLEAWIPLSAAQAATQVGEWTIVTRGDGAQQWAFQGRPLYRSAKDAKPSDVNGADDEWQPLMLPPAGTSPKPAAAPARPAGRVASKQ